MGQPSATTRRLLVNGLLVVTVSCSAATRPATVPGVDPVEHWLLHSDIARQIGEAAAANGWLAGAPGAVEELRAAMTATATASVDELEATLRPVVDEVGPLLTALRLRRPGSTRGDLAHWTAVSLIALGGGEADAETLAELRGWDREYLDQVLDLRDVGKRGNLEAAAEFRAFEAEPAPPGLLLEPWNWSDYDPIVARREVAGWPLFARPGDTTVAGVLAFGQAERLRYDEQRLLVSSVGSARTEGDFVATVAVYRVDPFGKVAFQRTRNLALGADQHLQVLAHDVRRGRIWVWLGDRLVSPISVDCCRLLRDPQITWWVRLEDGQHAGRWTSIGWDSFERRPWREVVAPSPTRSQPRYQRLGSLGMTDHPQIAGARLPLWRDGNGPPLFVLHGGPGFGSRYLREPLIEALGGERHVVVFDQRGSGYADGADDTGDLTMRRLVDDIDLLRERAQLDRIDLLGHSFGGLLALHYALAYPDRVGALVLVDPDPASRTDWEHFREIVDARTRESDAEEMARIASFDGWQDNPALMTGWFGLRLRAYTAQPQAADRVELIFDEFVLRNQRQTYPAIRADLGDWNLYSRLGEIQAPTLVVTGSASIFPPATAEAMRDGLSRGELRVLDGVGHFPFVEDPQSFAAVVLEFLRRVSPAE